MFWLTKKRAREEFEKQRQELKEQVKELKAQDTKTYDKLVEIDKKVVAFISKMEVKLTYLERRKSVHQQTKQTIPGPLVKHVKQEKIQDIKKEPPIKRDLIKAKKIVIEFFKQGYRSADARRAVVNERDLIGKTAFHTFWKRLGDLEKAGKEVEKAISE